MRLEIDDRERGHLIDLIHAHGLIGPWAGEWAERVLVKLNTLGKPTCLNKTNEAEVPEGAGAPQSARERGGTRPGVGSV